MMEIILVQVDTNKSDEAARAAENLLGSNGRTSLSLGSFEMFESLDCLEQWLGIFVVS